METGLYIDYDKDEIRIDLDEIREYFDTITESDLLIYNKDLDFLIQDYYLDDIKEVLVGLLTENLEEYGLI